MHYTIDGQTLLEIYTHGMSLHFDNGAWNWLLNQPYPNYNASDFQTIESGVEFAVILPRLRRMSETQRRSIIFILMEMK